MVKTKYSLQWAKKIFNDFYRKYPRATDLFEKNTPEASHRAIIDLAMGKSTWKKYTRDIKKLSKQMQLNF